jgi:LysR family glycine cleavage system transcriptional activator
MDWSHWTVAGGADVGQQSNGLNFSDPGLLLDAACGGLGIALVSQLLSQTAQISGLLQALTEQRIAGPNWAWLVHHDSANNPLTRSFCAWLESQLTDEQA